MADDFEILAESIQRVFSSSQFEPVTESKLVAIRLEYPDVPDHYIEFLRHIGWGTLGDSNFTIYSGLCKPDEFFDRSIAEDLSGILFFGDNCGGWMVGFDTRENWQIVGVDSSSPEPYPEEAQTLAAFIAQRMAD